MGPEFWEDHARRDLRNPTLIGVDGEAHSYDELLRLVSPEVSEQLNLATYAEKHERAQAALERLSNALVQAAPDVVVIVGDDQNELFAALAVPAIGIYAGDAVWDLPRPEADSKRLSEGMRRARWASHSPTPVEHRVDRALASCLAESLTEDGFDIMHLGRQPAGRSIGHAFNFVRYRLGLRPEVPIVPVLLNTYFRPNVLSPARCLRLGRAIRRGIERDCDRRIAIVASGGLSHFVVLEEFDRTLLAALAARDDRAIGRLPIRYFRSGTSESLNWITAAGALEHLGMQLVDYIPGYRSAAGTGTGMAFAIWS